MWWPGCGCGQSLDWLVTWPWCRLWSWLWEAILYSNNKQFFHPTTNAVTLCVSQHLLKHVYFILYQQNMPRVLLLLLLCSHCDPEDITIQPEVLEEVKSAMDHICYSGLVVWTQMQNAVTETGCSCNNEFIHRQCYFAGSRGTWQSRGWDMSYWVELGKAIHPVRQGISESQEEIADPKNLPGYTGVGQRQSLTREAAGTEKWELEQD